VCSEAGRAWHGSVVMGEDGRRTWEARQPRQEQAVAESPPDRWQCRPRQANGRKTGKVAARSVPGAAGPAPSDSVKMAGPRTTSSRRCR